jgi:hypothetical protein
MEYLIGTTICRLYFALCEFFSFSIWGLVPMQLQPDFLACPKNVLDVEPRCEWPFVLQLYDLTEFYIISVDKVSRYIHVSSSSRHYSSTAHRTSFLRPQTGTTFFES